LLATGFGSGYARVAPGTFGSVLGIPLAWACQFDNCHQLTTVVIGLLLFAVGVPICNAGARLLHSKDPKQVVFDEIAAFAWVFLFVPLNPTTAIAGFLLFRFFDVLKPWPISKFDELKGGFGIMIDDTVAGLIAGGILGGLWHLFSSNIYVT
ncbi:UNVERIFIED_CONTAM: hypothetical protein GTU68_043142, partial [Idotea baltica]|nr:hypothetical protein [Idotea baltica]